MLLDVEMKQKLGMQNMKPFNWMNEFPIKNSYYLQIMSIWWLIVGMNPNTIYPNHNNIVNFTPQVFELLSTISNLEKIDDSHMKSIILLLLKSQVIIASW